MACVYLNPLCTCAGAAEWRGSQPPLRLPAAQAESRRRKWRGQRTPNSGQIHETAALPLLTGPPPVQVLYIYSILYTYSE